MPVQSTLGRLRTVEFFGVLLPGLYVIGSIGFTFIARNAQHAPALIAQLRRHVSSDPKWYPVALAIFAAYIIGSIIRAIPISGLDNAIGALVRFAIGFRPLQSIVNERSKLLYKDRFPYLAMVNHIREDINITATFGSSYPPQSVSPGVSGDQSASRRPVFDYWKTYVRIKQPDYTSCLHELEARSRMFHGMSWAMLFSIVVSLLACNWAPTGLPLLLAIPSSIGLAVFASRLRHVRGEEVRHVYFAFNILRDDENAEQSEQSNSGLDQPRA